jgi:hypothetical protein
VLDSQKVVLEAARALAVEEPPQTSRTRTPMPLVTVVCGFLSGFFLLGQGLVAVRPALRVTGVRHPSQATAGLSSDKLLRPSARSGAAWPARPR